MIRQRENTFDHKCYDLAEFFLEDEPTGTNSEANRRSLAIAIQEAIEDHIGGLRSNYEPPDPMAHVEFPFAENH